MPTLEERYRIDELRTAFADAVGSLGGKNVSKHFPPGQEPSDDLISTREVLFDTEAADTGGVVRGTTQYDNYLVDNFLIPAIEFIGFRVSIFQTIQHREAKITKSDQASVIGQVHHLEGSDLVQLSVDDTVPSFRFMIHVSKFPTGEFERESAPPPAPPQSGPFIKDEEGNKIPILAMGSEVIIETFVTPE